jgi:hypothetical protein
VTSITPARCLQHILEIAQAGARGVDQDRHVAFSPASMASTLEISTGCDRLEGMPKRVKKIVKAKKSTKAKGPAKAKTLTLGLVGFAKISAVEGVMLRASTKTMFADFDRRGLSPAERRREIFEKHAKKS